MISPEPASTAGRSMPEQIAGVLREEILDGMLPPDGALRQGHLAARFGTSQAPVREALRLLESWGMAVSSARRGVRVAPLEADEAVELGELRQRLEPELARLAAAHPQRIDVAVARAAVGDMEAALRPAELMAANAAFHDALYGAADRPITHEIVRGLRARFERHLRLMWRSTGHAAISNDEHGEILRLALAGEGDAVAGLMEEHIGHSTAAILRALRETGIARSTSP